MANKISDNSALERLFNGVVKENPTFILALGMCPTLAVTTSAMNGLGMGLTTTAVLALSNLIISLLRKFIPNRVRIPAFIVIVASFVTMVQLLLQAYLPSLNNALGVYIPLIVVNCIILGRAESYAYHNPPLPSLFDGLGMGLGFSVALTLIGAVREILGTGCVFGFHIMPASYVTINIFVLAPGAFFVLAALTAIQNAIKEKAAAKGKDVSKVGSGCTEDCSTCGDKGCSHRFYDTESPVKNEAKVQSVTPAKKQEEKTEETKPEDTKSEETKSEETKAEEIKAEETKAEEVKAEETKAEDSKAEETKAEEIKAEEIKAEETKAEETKAAEVKPEDAKSAEEEEKDE